jgi:predicted Fe-Mo cluster-binding NifX family protein
MRPPAGEKGETMRIAIATDQDCVSSHFGCAPAFTIVELDEGRMRGTFTIPNPGCQHAFWADLFCRNSIKHLIAGAMGANAQAVIRGCGVDVILGVQGRLEEVVKRFLDGSLAADTKPGTLPGAARIPGENSCREVE